MPHPAASRPAAAVGARRDQSRARRGGRRSSTARVSCASSRTSRCSSSPCPASPTTTGSTTSSAICCAIVCGRADPDAESELLAVAAGWHAARGDTVAAIECLLDREALGSGARPHPRARARGLRARRDGDGRPLARRHSGRDPGRARGRQLLYGILEGMSGRSAIAEDTLRDVLLTKTCRGGAEVVARAYLAARCAVPAASRDLPRRGRAHAAADRRVTDCSSFPTCSGCPTCRMLNTLALTSIGRAHFYPRRRRAGRAPGSSAGSHPIGVGYAPFRIHMLGSLAIIEAWQGRLVRAAELADEALELARELEPPGPSRARRRVCRPRPGRHPARRARGRRRRAARGIRAGQRRTAARSCMWIAHAASRLVDPDGTDASILSPGGTPPPVVRMRASLHRAPPGCVRPAARRRSAPRPTWSATLFEDIAGLLTSRDAAAARTRLAAVAPAVRAPQSGAGGRARHPALVARRPRGATDGLATASAPRPRRGRGGGPRPSVPQRRTDVGGADPRAAGAARRASAALVLDRFAPAARMSVGRSPSRSRPGSWSCSRICRVASRTPSWPRAASSR